MPAQCDASCLKGYGGDEPAPHPGSTTEERHFITNLGNRTQRVTSCTDTGLRPWSWAIAAMVLGGLIFVFVALQQQKELQAFLASCGFLAGMLVMAPSSFGRRRASCRFVAGRVTAQVWAILPRTASKSARAFPRCDGTTLSRCSSRSRPGPALRGID